MLLGCKTDLADARSVSVSEAESFASRNELFFMEVSNTDKGRTNLNLTLRILKIRISHYVNLMKQQERRKEADARKKGEIEERAKRHYEQNQENLKMVQQKKGRENKWEEQSSSSLLKSKPEDHSSRALNSIREIGNDLKLFISGLERKAIQMNRDTVDHSTPDDQFDSTPILRRQKSVDDSKYSRIQSCDRDHMLALESSFRDQEIEIQSISEKSYGHSFGSTPHHDNTDSFSLESFSKAHAKLLVKKNAEDEGMDDRDGYLEHDPFESFEEEDSLSSPPRSDIPFTVTPSQPHCDVIVQNMNSYIKNFQETKDGYLIPVIETHLSKSPHQSSSFRAIKSPRAAIMDNNLLSTKKDRSPKIFIDINIGDGRVGQVAVSSGDNVFTLAEQFVRAFHLDAKYTRQLAYLIKHSIKKFIAKRKEIQQRKKLRNEHRLTREMERLKPPEFSMKSSPAKPIVKLSIDVGKGRTGTIIVREGDNPSIVAKNFARTFQLKEDTAKQIETLIREQLYKLSNNQHK